MAVYLADSSIWGWANKKTRPDITIKLAQRFARDEIATCAPVVLEAMQGANTGREYDELFYSLFAPIRWLELTDETAGRAVDVQRELAGTSHGKGLRPAVDFLVAAIAEAAGDVVLWFFGGDLRVICRHTGQPFEAESARA